MKVGTKMQDVDFRTVGEFLDYLPDDQRKITEVLRAAVFDCIPNVKEKLSFNVPFYSLNHSICYIWPSAILWGTSKKYEGVRLGFAHADRMEDPDGFLDMGKRKHIGIHDYLHLREVDRQQLEFYLFVALELDESGRKK